VTIGSRFSEGVPRGAWLRRRSVRSRLTALVVLAATLLVLALSTVLWLSESRQSSNRLDRSLVKRIDSVELSLRRNGRFPYTEPYGSAIDADYRILGSSQAVELQGLLTQSQIDFVLRNGGLQFRRADSVFGDTVRFLAQRRLIDGFPIVVVVGESEEVLRASRNQVRAVIAIGAPFLVALTGLGGWAIAGAILRPVRKMTDDAAAISEFDAKTRLAAGSGNDELTHLGVTLNSMLARLENSYRRERSFVDDASHELRTPLAIVRGELELALLHQRNPPETQTAIQRSIDEVDRMIALANDLLVSARSDASGVVGPSASSSVADVIRKVRSRFGSDDERVTFVEESRVPDGTALAMRADHAERVLLNLFENARRYAKTTVSVSSLIVEDGDFIEISVADDGPGFPPAFIDRAFERFSVANEARTRINPEPNSGNSLGHMSLPTSGGVGLGLAIVADLVTRAAGTVGAENNPAGGARVFVRIPVARNSPGASRL
jgi:two-component system, OmpR family, sensor kinase